MVPKCSVHGTNDVVRKTLRAPGAEDFFFITSSRQCVSLFLPSNILCTFLLPEISRETNLPTFFQTYFAAWTSGLDVGCRNGLAFLKPVFDEALHSFENCNADISVLNIAILFGTMTLPWNPNFTFKELFGKINQNF